MLLAVDIGNTNVTLGLYRGSRLAGSWRLFSDERKTADEVVLLLRGLTGMGGRGLKVAIASVVPALEVLYREAARKMTGREALVINHEAPLGFKVGYREPGDVGADRLVNAAAAVVRHGAPVTVVDFGTAVTVDVVDRSRTYLGGAILPGPELAAESLFRRTAKLPQIALAGGARAVGRTTGESMRAGIILGLAAAVDGLLERTFRELGGRTFVTATGGAAPLVVPHSRLLSLVEPDLTLEGIRIVAGRMSGPGRSRR
jgi:type III pantothenate kinase